MAKISQDVLAKLNGLTISTENVNFNNFPDFLILGPQRTGTTWLHANLQLHPQVFLTTPKEIYFFNLLNKPEHPFYSSNDLVWYLEFFHESFKSYLKNNLQSLKRYKEFYRPKIRGEATASYAAMSQELINNIVVLNPNIKAILMVRNPIMRTWAHGKKDLLNPSFLNNYQEKTLEQVTDDEFEKFFRREAEVVNYSSIIDNWSSSLKEGNLFIGFFDDIIDCPQKLLLQIFNFLEIDNKDKYITALAQKRINPTDKSSKRELPQKFKVILEEIFKDEIIRLEQRLMRKLIR